MKRQISFFDFIRFVASFTIFLWLFFSLANRGANVIRDDSGESALLLCLFFENFLPIFLSILISLVLISWRFKLVTGMLFLFLPLFFQLLELPTAMGNWIIFLYFMVQMSFIMIGGCLAIIIWNGRRNKFLSKGTKANNLDLKIARSKPKTSIILILLSLFSLPLTYIIMFCSAFITLGVSSLLLYLIFKLPRIPVVVIIAGVLAPLVGLWAGIRALWVMFSPPLQFEPGTIMELSKCPTLKTIIDNVCKKVRTRKPSVVVLHSEPTFFVMQGKLSTFDRIAKGRILTIGLPVLKELNIPELSSVLAHEFAHFSGRDTIYSTIVSPVYRGIIASMNELSGATEGDSSGDSTGNLMKLLLLPSQIFLGLFLQYFATIDKILSRSRELRADWIAANLFGANNFSTALTKVTTIGQHFNESYENLALNSDKDFFIKHSQLLQQNSSKLEEYRSKACFMREEDFDSHPCFSSRLLSLPENTKEDIEYLNETQNLRTELAGKEEELSKKYTGRMKKIKELWEQYSAMMNQTKEQIEKVKQEKIAALENSKPLYCPSCYKTYNKFISNMCKKCNIELLDNPNYVPKKVKGDE